MSESPAPILGTSAPYLGTPVDMREELSLIAAVLMDIAERLDAIAQTLALADES